MSYQRWIKFFSFIACSLFLPLAAQELSPGDATTIRALMEEGQFNQADRLLQKQIDRFFSQQNFDTIVYFIALKGEVTFRAYDEKKADAEVLALIKRLKEQGASALQILNAYKKVADFLETQSDYARIYEMNDSGTVYANRLQKNRITEVAQCEYNMGVCAYRLGQAELSERHHRRALALRERQKDADPEDLFVSYNALGGVMWNSLKLDSARIFYEKSLKALEAMPDEDMNRYYRPAMVYNNLAAVYSQEGNVSLSVQSMHKVIRLLQKFISSPTPNKKKESAEELTLQALDNLAGIYRDLGDYRQAQQLLLVSYREKQKKLKENNPGIFYSEVLLGQNLIALNDYASARNYLTNAIEHLDESDQQNLFWSADAWYNLALVNENDGNIQEAARCYEISNAKYEQSYQGQYDNMYLDFLRNASSFYAKTKHYEKAYEIANRIQQYLISVGEEEGLQGVLQAEHLAKLNYLAERYAGAERYSARALTILGEKLSISSTAMDSIRIEGLKPAMMLLLAQSRYAVQPKKDSVFLNGLAMQLDTALEILERKKVFIDGPENIRILMADHQQLIDFASKIALELYEMSGGVGYLEQFINLRESKIYGRARARLDQADAIRFSGVPSELLERETLLKTSLQTVLAKDPVSFCDARSRWDMFLDSLSKFYPDYYQLRYAILFRSLNELQQSLPNGFTLVRYYQIDSGVVALVADQNSRKLIRLDAPALNENITIYLNNSENEAANLRILRTLYTQLWEPVKPYIHTRRVTIIPDGVLYNLSFEMLPFEPVTHYSELADKGLIARHILSYQYSIFGLGKKVDNYDGYQSNYVAFAPGFSDDLKDKYRQNAGDSLLYDYGYLRLLPQPTTGLLARKIEKDLGGTAYVQDESTVTSFRQNAGNHKIIFVATHAAYDNVYPENSNLIFAKGSHPFGDSNRLFLNDIYGCDTRSELTMLTACETGRPGFQDGEGMISLAHAFNYAGSKNIVTALWKIDEKSSGEIVDHFIAALKDGKATDEALRAAKLAYLSTARGRLCHPGYWAGMVLIGTPQTVSFSPHYSLSLYLTVAAILFIAIVAFFAWKKNYPARQ